MDMRSANAQIRGTQMKHVIVATLALTLLSSAAKAQDFPAAEVAVGYSMIDVVKGPSQIASGANGSIGFNFNSWLGVVGDLGVYSASPSLTAITYTAGPRISFRPSGRHWNRVVPFAQVLFGGAHASSSAANYGGATNAYAFGAGGGADFALDHGQRFMLQPQLEYFRFGTLGSGTDAMRLCLGIVFRISKSGAAGR
jgi:hypothetical protein